MNPVEILSARSGRWSGSNALHESEAGPPEESPSTAVLTPILGGRFVRVDYTWAHRGRPQEGSLLIGFDPTDGVASGHWVDTWHLGRVSMAFAGNAAPDGTLVLAGTYPVPPGPDWGWRIEIAAGDRLRIAHKNIHPDGREDPAVEATYTRTAG